jgi:hypothetical protein
MELAERIDVRENRMVIHGIAEIQVAEAAPVAVGTGRNPSIEEIGV